MYSLLCLWWPGPTIMTVSFSLFKYEVQVNGSDSNEYSRKLGKKCSAYFMCNIVKLLRVCIVFCPLWPTPFTWLYFFRPSVSFFPLRPFCVVCLMVQIRFVLGVMQVHFHFKIQFLMAQLFRLHTHCKYSKTETTTMITSYKDVGLETLIQTVRHGEIQKCTTLQR